MGKQRIGFVVEGSTDKAIAEALALRIMGAQVEPYVIRIGGPIAWRWAHSTVLMLLEEKRCRHVVLLFDADAPQGPQVDRRRQEIEAMLDEHRLGKEEVSVCLAVQAVESWLLAAHDERPEEVAAPKAALLEHLGERSLTPEHSAELVGKLDIEKACDRSPSFSKFVSILRKVAEQSSQAPAA
jgi:ribosomal protein L30/L7E